MHDDDGRRTTYVAGEPMTSGAPRVMVLVVILRGTRGDNLAAWSCMVRHAVMFCCRFPGRPLYVFYVEFLRHFVLIVYVLL